MDKTLQDTGLCVVLVRQELVAQDIALTLSDRFEATSVKMAHGVAEALASVVGADRIHAAVLELSPDCLKQSDLEREIVARGGRIVLVGKLAEAAAEQSRWPVLIRPFADQTLLSLLG